MSYYRFCCCLGFIAVLVLLCACAGKPETVTVPVEVKVPVRAPCVPEGYSKRPDYVDSDAALRAAPGAAERLLLLAAGRLQRIDRERANDAVIDGCR